MREIKFRVFNKYGMSGPMDIFEMTSCDGSVEEYPEDTIFMQYTCLKDKNGVEIYEGDILKAVSDKGSEILKVIYFMGNACFAFGRQETGAAIYPALINMTKEVIGNIHENPELLEEE